MKLAILHLSDIHFGRSPNDFILQRTNKISSAAAGVFRNVERVLVLVTGDIAFTGSVQQYQVAHTFFEQIEATLQARLSNVAIEFLLVPGNHDCDFSTPDSVRDLLLESISEEKIDDKVISQIASVQSNFHNFASVWHRSKDSEIRVHGFKEFDAGGDIIRFNLINSAWMSTKNEIQGKLLFPMSKLQNTLGSESGTALIIITAFHHPYSWFNNTNSRAFQRAIESTSDIVLTGHEHDSDFYSKVRPHGIEIEFIEGGTLQGKSNRDSEFNAIVIDLDDKTHEIYHFSWNDADELYEHPAPDIRPLIRNSIRLRKEYMLRTDFEKELSDPGVRFTHPDKHDVFLEDIFVDPPIKTTHLHGENEWTKAIIRESLADYALKNGRVLLIGSEKCGKTSLAKSLFKEFRRRSLIPLMIPGEGLKNCDEHHVIADVQRYFEKSYESPVYSAYEQLEPEKKVLIVDDFQKCSLNHGGKDKILKLLESLFSTIVLLGNDQLRFSDLVTTKLGDRTLFRDFTTCEMMEFGQGKRTELVRKWYALGKSEAIDEATLKQQTLQASKLVASLIGRNFIPSYPIFVLGILQQLELQNPVNTKSGIYGFVYESLLTMAFAQKTKKIGIIDTQYSYLAELAFWFYSHHISTIEGDELALWHQEYCSNHALLLDQDRIIGELCDVSVLQKDIVGISFRYSYLYYYFVSRYLSEHVSEPEIRRLILWMCERLHHTESANILIFLCYSCKDPYILETLLTTSKALFASYKECDIAKDTKLISALIPDVPRFLPEVEESSESQDESLAENTENVVTDPGMHTEENVAEKLDRELEEILQLNVAFKTIQILGQLLRNFSGSLVGKQKLALARECYSLGLRVTKFLLETIESNREDMVQSLAEFLNSQNPKWPYERLNTEVKFLLFSIMEGFTFVLVKHVSDSVGLELLTLTYKELLQTTENTSYRFIDLSVHLDNFKGFPENAAKDLYKIIRKNRFAVTLFKHLLWYYMHLYPVPYNLRQSISERFEIQHTYDLKSKAPKLLKR